MVIEILLLFVPGILGVALYRWLEKAQWRGYTYIENYAIFTFFAYFMNCSVLYLRGWEEFSIQTIGVVAQIKYGVLSLVFVTGLAVVLHLWKAVRS